MGKIGLIAERFDQFSTLGERKRKLDTNTGNLLFMHALQSILDCEIVSPDDHDWLRGFDALVTTALIWIRPNVAPFPEVGWCLDNLDCAVVPISVGLQASDYRSDFALHPEVVRVLSAIAERSGIAARGTYTAEVLHRHGIGNVTVTGCPSLYLLPMHMQSLDPLFAAGGPQFTAANYRTFFPKIAERDHRFLRYIADHCDGFLEQTWSRPHETEGMDPDVVQWLARHTHMFFDLPSWLVHQARYDFSMGERFHGNVAALLAGMRALFMVIDSRTREMTEHMRLPTIDSAAFDTDRPLAHYFDLADYSAFRAGYGTRLSEFTSFLDRNGLPMRESFGAARDAFGG